MLLGDKNDQLLERDKRSCQLRGGVLLATLSLPGGSSGKGRDITRFGLGKVLSAAPSFLSCSWHLEGKQAAVAVGRTGYHSGVLFPAPFSCHEWSSASESSQFTGTLLTPNLTNKGLFTICWGASGKIPGSPSPFPLQVSLLGSYSPAPALLLPLLWVFYYCSHVPRLLRHP